MFTRSFWVQTAERALKTAAQAALALLTLDAAAPASLFSADWRALGSAVVLAALASVLTSVVGAGVGPTGTPSVVDVTDPHPGLYDAFSAWVASKATDEFGASKAADESDEDEPGRHALTEDHPYA